jgi:pullulanase
MAVKYNTTWICSKARNCPHSFSLRLRMPWVVALLIAAFVTGAFTISASHAANVTGSAQENQSLRIAQSLKAKNAAAKALLVVHYARADKKYDRWNAWCWPEGAEGAAFPFTGKDVFGHYAVIPFKEKPKSAGFILRLGDWEQKDIDHDRTITFDTGDAQEIWLVAGDERVYTNPNEIDLSVRVLAAFLDKDNEITLATTAPLTKEQILKAQVTQRGNVEFKHKIKAFLQIQKSLSSRAMYGIQLTKPIADADIA